MGEPLFDLIFKYRQKHLLAVLNVCFDMLKRTKRNETERNALNQPKSLSTTSRHILHYHIATNLELYRFLQCYFIVCVLFKLCDHQRRGRWYRPFVVNVIVWRSRVPSPTTIRYCYANADREREREFMPFSHQIYLKRTISKRKMRKSIEWCVKWCKDGCEHFISIYYDSSSQFGGTHKQNRLCLNDKRNR